MNGRQYVLSVLRLRAQAQFQMPVCRETPARKHHGVSASAQPRARHTYVRRAGAAPAAPFLLYNTI